ncbi:hypothetical protein TSAR_002082 [Trichomalopsis sarcophagae]|uniref:Uncharacterized protein n=1 Tax=Trichomalopsis sarcophagae TaxID=543379 RepID=A0A232FEF0_9HYME|nr:hypothetical protein TSAR_002082 [Trichomalopsis sarcophagae]
MATIKIEINFKHLLSKWGCGQVARCQLNNKYNRTAIGTTLQQQSSQTSGHLEFIYSHRVLVGHIEDSSGNQAKELGLANIKIKDNLKSELNFIIKFGVSTKPVNELDL